jgi:hypothetical protein
VEVEPDFQNGSQHHHAQDDAEKDQVQATVQNEQAYLKNQAEPEKQGCSYPHFLQPVSLLFPAVLRFRCLAFGADSIPGGQSSTAFRTDGGHLWIRIHSSVTLDSRLNKSIPYFYTIGIDRAKIPGKFMFFKECLGDTGYPETASIAKQ